MQTNKSCGILLFDENTTHFLLLRTPKKWDLPKGHLKKRETELECALREFNEETSIDISFIELVDDFKFNDVSYHQDKITMNYHQKEYIIFMAKLKEKAKIRTTEHISFKWFELHTEIDFKNSLIEQLIDYTKTYIKGKEL